jgi:hypothetical protein
MDYEQQQRVELTPDDLARVRRLTEEVKARLFEIGLIMGRTMGHTVVPGSGRYELRAAGKTTLSKPSMWSSLSCRMGRSAARRIHPASAPVPADWRTFGPVAGSRADGEYGDVSVGREGRPEPRRRRRQPTRSSWTSRDAGGRAVGQAGRGADVQTRVRLLPVVGLRGPRQRGTGEPPSVQLRPGQCRVERLRRPHHRSAGMLRAGPRRQPGKHR